MKMKVLALLAATSALAQPASAAPVELVTNGGFEQIPASPGLNGGGWAVFTNGIPGWAVHSGNGIEIQTNPTLGSIDAHGGKNYVELDSHPNDGHSNTVMKQNLLLQAGDYVLSFFYSPRQGRVGTSSNDIAFSLGNLISGLVGGPTLANSQTCPAAPDTRIGCWTGFTYAFSLKPGQSGPYDLMFGATGYQETLGGLLDDVSLQYTPSAVPVPAAGFLLFGALGGLAALRRRKQA